MKISTQEMVLAALFTAIMCVLTILVRMFQPVFVIPFSLQPLVMLLAACLLSPRGVFLSMTAYLFLGLLGLPVFSAPPYGGPAYVLIPSFGFLLGFPLAGWLQSKLIKQTSLVNFTLAGLVAIITYYAIGLPYMYLILRFYLGNTLDIVQILQIGLIPFITFDLIKVVVAASLALQLSRRLNINRELVANNFYRKDS
ncbi:MAG: biotin transporter BioY [Syntrophomonadaceae bacterium]|jgi:biotin transport system substrate-specific component